MGLVAGDIILSCSWQQSLQRPPEPSSDPFPLSPQNNLQAFKTIPSTTKWNWHAVISWLKSAIISVHALSGKSCFGLQTLILKQIHIITQINQKSITRDGDARQGNRCQIRGCRIGISTRYSPTKNRTDANTDEKWTTFRQNLLRFWPFIVCYYRKILPRGSISNRQYFF